MTFEAAVAALTSARQIAAFTGAGISTESGLPDFRSPGGLWAGMDPMRVASRTAMRENPQAFYRFYRERLARLAGAAPNPAHHALAALERAGRLQAVITQNVDGLHQAAGSRRVLELHGNLREAACVECGAVEPIARLATAVDTGALPRCQRCGGLLKPNVVLFEDLLPGHAWEEAVRVARRSEVLLVVGSSLQVTPAAYLPDETLRAGGRLIIVNREPTPYDGAAEAVLRGAAGDVVPALARAMGVDPRPPDTPAPGAPGRSRDRRAGEEPTAEATN